MVKTTELSLSLTPYLNVFHKNLLAIGSTPVLGSSKNYILGPPINALLTHNFLLFPPDNRPAYLYIYSSNCIVLKK